MSSGAVALVPDDQIGRSYGSNDVHQLGLDRLRANLEAMHPELKARGVEICARLQLAQLELETLQLDLRRTCGEYASDAMAMLKREAAKQVTQGLEQERLKVESDSIRRANDVAGKPSPGEQAHAALSKGKSKH